MSNWWEENSASSESLGDTRRNGARLRYRQAKFWEDEHLGGPVSTCARKAPACLDRERNGMTPADAGNPFCSELGEPRGTGKERSLSMLDITRYLKLSGSLYDGQDKAQWMDMSAKRIYPGVRSLVESRSGRA